MDGEMCGKFHGWTNTMGYDLWLGIPLVVDYLSCSSGVDTGS